MLSSDLTPEFPTRFTPCMAAQADPNTKVECRKSCPYYAACAKETKESRGEMDTDGYTALMEAMIGRARMDYARATKALKRAKSNEERDVASRHIKAIEMDVQRPLFGRLTGIDAETALAALRSKPRKHPRRCYKKNDTAYRVYLPEEEV